MEFREFIKAKRLEAGISQRELGRRISASSGLISLYEAGAVEPTVEKAEQICEALGTTYVLGGSNHEGNEEICESNRKG